MENSEKPSDVKKEPLLYPEIPAESGRQINFYPYGIFRILIKSLKILKINIKFLSENIDFK